jgi:hypothetical protein
MVRTLETFARVSHSAGLNSAISPVAVEQNDEWQLQHRELWPEVGDGVIG